MRAGYGLRLERSGGCILPSSRVGPAARAARASSGTGFSRVRRYCFSISRGGVGDAVGESAVVGEDEQARRVRVEAARGHEARHVGHQVGDRLAAALVFHGGQVARGFVQGQVDQGVGEADAACRRAISRLPAVTEVPRVALSPLTVTRPASIGDSALRREGAAPARARNACRRTTRAPAPASSGGAGATSGVRARGRAPLA